MKLNNYLPGQQFFCHTKDLIISPDSLLLPTPRGQLNTKEKHAYSLGCLLVECEEEEWILVEL